MEKRGYFANIENKALAGQDYRRVLYTGKFSQLVLMSLLPGEEIGWEVHRTHDQFFRFEAGMGEVVVNGKRHGVSGGDCAIVPAGAKHNVINTGRRNMKLYTIYSPPEHRNGTVRRTLANANSYKEHFDGHLSE